jgi:SH3-like domain-containing protein
MKCLKTFAIAVLAGAALLAVAGVNSAAAETVLCTEKTAKCPSSKADGTGTEIKASLVSGTKSKLTTPYNNIECGKSSFTAKVTSTGEKVSSNVESLTFEECGCEVKVLAKGTLELKGLASSVNATVRSTGTEITTLCNTISGEVHCIYKTEATDLGTLEGGNPAKVKISGAEIPRLTTNTRCNEGGFTTKWDAEYEVTSPKPLYIEPEKVVETGAVLCTETATPCGKADGTGTEIKASLVSGTKSTLTTSFKNIECGESSITAKATSTGKAVVASVESFTLGGCNCEFKALANGTLSFEPLAGTDNATVSSSGTEVTTTCSSIFGNVHCIFSTSNTDLGTLEGGNPAKVKISEASIPRLTTNAFCAEKANWDVTYEVTSPKPLYIEPE